MTLLLCVSALLALFLAGVYSVTVLWLSVAVVSVWAGARAANAS